MQGTWRCQIFRRIQNQPMAMNTVLTALNEALIAGRSLIVIFTDLHQPLPNGYAGIGNFGVRCVLARFAESQDSRAIRTALQSRKNRCKSGLICACVIVQQCHHHRTSQKRWSPRDQPSRFSTPAGDFDFAARDCGVDCGFDWGRLVSRP